MLEKTLAKLAIKAARAAGENIEDLKAQMKAEAHREIDELFKED